MAYLFDVNVLIALMWPAHEAHVQVQEWFARNASQGWATCPFTEAAFVRITSNPAFSRDAVPPHEALKILAANVSHPSHQFWPDEISFVQAAQPFAKRLIGHQQVTDAYLLGLAIHHEGKLVSCDRAILSLVPEKSRERGVVAII